MLDGKHVRDDLLAIELDRKEQYVEIPPKDIEIFLRICLTGRLPKAAKFLMAQDRYNTEAIVRNETPSIIFKAHEEDVIIDIMKSYTKESWKYMSMEEELKENLLHFFIRNKFKKALTHFLQEDLSREELGELCFQPNQAEKIPLMTCLDPGMESSAQELWRLMENWEYEISEHMAKENVETINDKLDTRMREEDEMLENEMKDKNEIDASFTAVKDGKQAGKTKRLLNFTNSKEENILHMCSSTGQNNLLLDICTSRKLPKENIEEALLHRNSRGRTALSLCTDEDIILTILASVDIIRNPKIKTTDAQGKNILHNYAQRDLNNAIGFLIKRLPENEAIEMVCQESTSNKSNVFMTSAIHGSGKTLELLLNFALLFKVDNSSFSMDTMLHHKNEYGNTLLSLILQSKDDLLVPKMIVLGMEKEFHSRDGKGDGLMCCFHNNLEASGEVLEAIKDVRKTQEKSTAAIVGIWVQSFFKAFLVPVGIMSIDVAFDVFLVREYAQMDSNCLTALWDACSSSLNETPPALTCGSNSTELVPRGNGAGFFCLPKEKCYDLPSVPTSSLNIFCIPLKLGARPRFFYSIGFIVCPWVYFSVEFLQSPEYDIMYKVSTFFGNQQKHVKMIIPLSISA